MTTIDERLYLAAGAGLFAIGFCALLNHRNLLRRVMALNVMGAGVFMVFIAMAALGGGEVPDPVLHAMVLTGVVVSVCATGLALALAIRVDTASNTERKQDPEAKRPYSDSDP